MIKLEVFEKHSKPDPENSNQIAVCEDFLRDFFFFFFFFFFFVLVV